MSDAGVRDELMTLLIAGQARALSPYPTACMSAAVYARDMPTVLPSSSGHCPSLSASICSSIHRARSWAARDHAVSLCSCNCLSVVYGLVLDMLCTWRRRPRRYCSAGAPRSWLTSVR
jgi:hypothetical protein